ncbi:MAG: DUF6603 domain-containing protein [Woeseiaceae bacterium]
MPGEENIGSLEALALGLGELFAPLEKDLAGGKARVLLAELGLQLPASADAGAFGNAVDKVATAAGAMPAQIEKLITDLGGGDYGPVVQTGTELIKNAMKIIQGIDELATAIRGLSGTTGIPAGTLNTFADRLPRRLVDYLIVRNLEGAPIIPEALEFIGVIERNFVASADPNAPSLTEYGFHVDRASAFVQSPLGRLRTLYDWGDLGFDGSKMLPVLQNLFGKAGFPAIVDDTVSPPVLDAIVFEAQARTDLNPRGLEIRLAQRIDVDNAVPFNSGGDWQLEGLATGDIDATTALVIQPDGNLTLTPPAAMGTGKFGLRFTAKQASGEPFLIFGDPDGSRMQVESFSLEASAGFNFDSEASASAEGFFGGDIKGGRLEIDMGSGDGFLAEILSGLNIASDFELGFGVSSDEGLFFVGSAELEVQLPAHIDLGPIEISALTFSAGIDGGTFPLTVSADIMAQLGPIAASVEEIGVRGLLSIPPDKNDGNLGPLDFELGFQPPKGVGLAVDAGPVKGGGYLFFDFDREEYAGALELVFSEWIALRAVGLITTRLPDGSKGFSMLIIITVEFGSGIQLGFGFTLLGVGGLIGVNRTVNIQPLTDGIRTGAVESVMFPQDIIANAPRIISDLRSFFPPLENSFLLGPMAKIGWGTPTLVSVSLGIVLEIPSINITILGIIKVVLPDEQVDILRLQVNFIGRIEPANKLLWFYAELYDSRVLFITLEGGMGLYLNWGDQANFVVSVGGFHPRYNPPPLPFPEPPRLAVSILNESFARIRIEAYFAVTSNSVQFGARAELFFGLDEFKIEGHLAFDALFQFDPFFFSFGLSFSLSVKVFGIGLFSVGFSGLLEGPTPWHIEGKGSISLLFFDIKVPFSHTWGSNEDTKLDPITVMPLLEAEVAALTNWRAELPAGNHITVSLRQLGDSDADQLVLHPVGSLKFSQRKIPLNLKIDKVGNQRPSDANEFALDVTVGSGGTSQETLREQFATGQFIDLDDSERLSVPGFAREDSGVEIDVAGETRKTSQAVKRVIRYEEIIIDNRFRRFLRPFFEYFRAGFGLLNEFLFNHFLHGAAVADSPLSNQFKKRLEPYEERIAVKDYEFSVAFNADNTSVDNTVSFASYAKAAQFMNQQISENPALQNELHVIPNVELAA